MLVLPRWDALQAEKHILTLGIALTPLIIWKLQSTTCPPNPRDTPRLIHTYMLERTTIPFISTSFQVFPAWHLPSCTLITWFIQEERGHSYMLLQGNIPPSQAPASAGHGSPPRTAPSCSWPGGPSTAGWQRADAPNCCTRSPIEQERQYCCFSESRHPAVGDSTELTTNAKVWQSPTPPLLAVCTLTGIASFQYAMLYGITFSI